MAALERAAITYSCDNANFLERWVPRDTFDFVWALAGGTILDARYELFLRYYEFEEGFVEIIPDEEIEVYFVPEWLLYPMLLWFGENGSDCPTGGDIVNFPEPGFSPCD